MRKLLLIVFSALLFPGCSRKVEVNFVYYNLSGHQIIVTDVTGLPAWASPGVLVPVSDDSNRLNEKSATSWEAVRIAEQLKIHWTEADQQRELLLKRSELGLPARLAGGRLCFTYLGNGKWRAALR
jgi:hypothetical protein